MLLGRLSPEPRLLREEAVVLEAAAETAPEVVLEAEAILAEAADATNLKNSGRYRNLI